MIELQELQFSYSDASDSPVIDIPSWKVETSERVFVFGPSGCGKSTLLNLLSGLLMPTRGALQVCDQRLDKLGPRQRDQFRAQHIGYVFQQFNLLPYLNAVENVHLASYFPKNAHAQHTLNDTKTLLNALNISDMLWSKPIASLSIGQQQRVAIARALINKPKLLIADEPTSSLDQHNRDNFMDVLMSLVKEQDITLIFVSHDMSLASYFERVDSLADVNQLQSNSVCL
jgi:putative ABC transport system ATP-binding protein